jgi:hypothetical protein
MWMLCKLFAGYVVMFATLSIPARQDTVMHLLFCVGKYFQKSLDTIYFYNCHNICLPKVFIIELIFMYIQYILVKNLHKYEM